MEASSSIQERVLGLRDVALGVQRRPGVSPELSRASYDGTVDSLIALHDECSLASGLAKKNHIKAFLNKYKSTVDSLVKLRISAEDFEVKGIIGRGHFGEVQVVQDKNTKEVFAMKIMNKAHILQQSDSACFSEERDIMAWARSPWLTSLHYAFQDPASLYLVMEYHPGGDLLTVMERRDGGMTEPEARFYLSEIAAGLNDLHVLGFAHRDVKPENVLISRSGHIKLVDFGSAARLGNNRKVVDSHLPVGTPEYIAPEVLTSLNDQGEYGVCCDWWSLGIIAYELLYVSTPFDGDTTTITYSNIMNYKEHLSFPDDPETSSEFQSLITSLLTEPELRLEFPQLQEHPFFSSVDWSHLLAESPPYIPTVAGPDDTSNFDEYEPKKEDGIYSGTALKSQTEFSGKSLPFVGFTFTRFSHSKLDFPDSGPAVSSTEVVTDSQWTLDRAQAKLKQLKERNKVLEKECVVYQNQLQDYSVQLDKERAERKSSDSQAVKLLEEVKQHSQTLRQLRKEEISDKELELNVVVSQLEQERQVVSNRAKRLQGELTHLTQERDVAVKVALELKTKLKQLKESSKKDISSLQRKLNQMTKDSSSHSAGLHEKLTDAMEQFVTANKKLKEKEESEKLNCSKIQELEASLESFQKTDEASKLQLDTEIAGHIEKISELEDKMESLASEKALVQDECEELRQSNKSLISERSEAKALNISKMDQVKSESETVRSLQEAVLALQRKLSETGETAIKHSERLRAVRSEKRTTDLRNSELTLQLRKAETDKQQLEQRFEVISKEMEGFKNTKIELTTACSQVSKLQTSQEVMSVELENLREERGCLLSDNQNKVLEMSTLKEKLSSQELDNALAQRKLKLTEEELVECKTVIDDLNTAEKQWKSTKHTLTSDLETAETSLDDLQATLSKERDVRTKAEKKHSELLLILDQSSELHREELTELREELKTQKSIIADLNQKVLVVEKEVKLKELALKETQKDLETEKACYSKTYEDLYSLNRDYHALKAAYTKLLRECEEQRAELLLTTETRDRIMDEQRSVTEARQLQETRMQSTIEQQSKLIDFLQVGVTPRSNKRKLPRMGLKFSRKGRDPIKEIAEWNKLKGFIAKPDSNNSSLVSRDTSVSTSPARGGSNKNKKAKNPLRAANRASIIADESVVLSFPVRDSKTSGEAPAEAPVVSTPIAKGGAASVEIKVEVEAEEIVEENVSAPKSMSGRGLKRKFKPENSDLEPPVKIASVRHNIPHKFQVHKSGIHKSYSCAGCGEVIKRLQRYAKCSYCSQVGHPSCADKFPNDCGLPAELATQTVRLTSSHTEPAAVTESPIGDFDTVKIERLTYLHDTSRTLGWLVLKSSSFSFYDRNPDYAIARKPLCHIDFTAADCVCEALSYIHERFGFSQKQLDLAFGIRQYSSGSTKDVVFIAPSVQSKVEWIEAISGAFSMLFKENDTSKVSSGAKTKRRSLKSVSIVPISLNTSLNETNNLTDLSIRSSMLEDSTNSSIV